ncbi:nucleoside phosphorylase domain-containing protein [Aspergillus varians]
MSFMCDDYTVAWICALPLEMSATEAMLDEVHPSLPQPSTDHNVYILGAVGNHNVVVACLPSGVYGTISAAVVVSHLVSTFSRIRFGLMVGIGGGVPRDSADIRLGDIVVSKPITTSPGVIQYDYGKTLREGKLQRTGVLNKPPQVLLKAMAHIESDYMSGKRQASSLMPGEQQQTSIEINKKFARPESDMLFKSAYNHKQTESDCSACDLHQLVNRPLRSTDEPYIHYGLIASGDQVIKDAKTRDSIAQELNVLCFEMEAAGVIDEIPSLVIRGICDYCDSHKNKQWQGYAAWTAAAYAKSLLSTVPAVFNNRESRKVGFTTEEEACLQSLFLTDPADDKSSLRRRKGNRANGTCEWILETDEIVHWLVASGILWLHGNPGTGKSTIAMTMTDELPKQPLFADGTKVLAYFFCDSSSEKHRTAVSILRGLIYALVRQCPLLVKFLLPKYRERKENLYTSFDALWNILMEMGQDCAVEIYCIIDALDECESDSQQDILRQIDHSSRGQSTTDSASFHPHILITSRPYPEIGEYLSHFKNRDLASYSAVKKDLKVMIQEKVTDLAKRKKYPESVTKEVSKILEAKAEGTFLWVGIACGELTRPGIRSRNAIRILQGMPPGLYALYRRLLNTALVNTDDNEDEKKTIVNIMKFVAFARRPLTVLELSTLCQLYPDDDEASRLQFTKDLIDMCRLMIVIQDERVRLLHNSCRYGSTLHQPHARSCWGGTNFVSRIRSPILA